MRKDRAAQLVTHAVIFYSTHFKPPPFRGMRRWPQGINPSLPGTPVAFWSSGLGQHSRTASTQDNLN